MPGEIKAIYVSILTRHALRRNGIEPCIVEAIHKYRYEFLNNDAEIDTWRAIINTRAERIRLKHGP